MSTMAEAREVWNNVSDEVFHDLVWSCTSFPCGSSDMVADQLIRLHSQHGGDAGRAITVSMQEFDDAWEEYKRIHGV